MLELKDRITFSEFLDWCDYLLLEERRHTKQDWYLAQIAAEVFRTIAKEPKKVRVKSYLHKVEDDPSQVPVSNLPPEQRLKKSKSSWMSALGLKKKKPAKKKP